MPPAKRRFTEPTKKTTYLLYSQPHGVLRVDPKPELDADVAFQRTNSLEALRNQLITIDGGRTTISAAVLDVGLAKGPGESLTGMVEMVRKYQPDAPVVLFGNWDQVQFTEAAKLDPPVEVMLRVADLDGIRLFHSVVARVLGGESTIDEDLRQSEQRFQLPKMVMPHVRRKPTVTRSENHIAQASRIAATNKEQKAAPKGKAETEVPLHSPKPVEPEVVDVRRVARIFLSSGHAARERGLAIALERHGYKVESTPWKQFVKDPELQAATDLVVIDPARATNPHEVVDHLYQMLDVQPDLRLAYLGDWDNPLAVETAVGHDRLIAPDAILHPDDKQAVDVIAGVNGFKRSDFVSGTVLGKAKQLGIELDAVFTPKPKARATSVGAFVGQSIAPLQP